MQIKEILQKTTDFFRNKGFESPRLETELLISSALHWERMKLYLNHEYPLTEAEVIACREFVKRRATGEPVAYIIGSKGFYKHSFKVTPSVLIPRPETETMVDEAIMWAMKNAPAARVVDLGTGSGCIGISLLAALPEAKLFAVDLSEEALKVAEMNAADIGVLDRATYLKKDAALLEALDLETTIGGLADLVLANPPYIAEDDPDVQDSVRKFEPSQALFADDQGFAFIKSWCTAAARIARPGAFVMFEIGHEQGALAAKIFEATGKYENITVVKDLSGLERFIRATRREIV
jgi:release factor glutamine methyltransferase